MFWKLLIVSCTTNTLEWGTLQVCGCQWRKAEYQKNVEIGEINQIRVWNISQPNHSTLNFDYDYDDDDDYYHYYWWHILTEITFLDIPLVWTLPNKTKIWISLVLKIWNKVRVENLHPFIYLSIFCTRFLLHSRLRKLEHMTWLNTKPVLILALVLRSDTSGNWFASSLSHMFSYCCCCTIALIVQRKDTGGNPSHLWNNTTVTVCGFENNHDSVEISI